MSLVELMVGATVFTLMMGMSLASVFSFYNARQKILAQDEISDETRILMERIVREVRVNTIDYYEYFEKQYYTNSNVTDAATPPNITSYGVHPGEYEMRFYRVPEYNAQLNGKYINNIIEHPTDFSWNKADRNKDKEMGYFDTHADKTENIVDNGSICVGIDNLSSPATSDDRCKNDNEESSALNNYNQKELYLLSECKDATVNTLCKTIIRLEKEAGTARGIVKMKKMILRNREWQNDTDFANFVPISPAKLNVTQLDFFITPKDDPRKAYAESAKPINGVWVNPHIQPNVIITLKVKLSDDEAKKTIGNNPELKLQTTAASRVFNNVTFPRN